MERISFEEQISKNKWKSLFLILIIVVVFIALGYAITFAVSPDYFFIIMIISIIFSVGYVIISFYNSSKIALFSVGAKPASSIEHRMLFNAVENMSIASGLPMPKVYFMESEQINAFASGRNPQNAVICITTGALKKLNKQELEGVIAHEMSHIANYDIRFMTLTAVLVGMISIISEIYLRSLWFSSGGRDNKKGNAIFVIIAIALAVLAPITARLVSLAISRKREFAADATGVRFTRYSPGLRSALKKIKLENVPKDDLKRYSHATAPLFMSDPFKSKIKSIFSTHPSIDKRIELLEKM